MASKLYISFQTWIAVVRMILDSLSCILDSKAQDPWFYKLFFLRFRIPPAKISWIPESEFPYMGQFNVLKSFIYYT